MRYMKWSGRPVIMARGPFGLHPAGRGYRPIRRDLKTSRGRQFSLTTIENNPDHEANFNGEERKAT